MSRRSHDTYEAPSAVQPVLASKLLKSELNQHRIRQAVGPASTGIKSVDLALPRTLWTGGKVIGITGVEGSPSVSLDSMVM